MRGEVVEGDTLTEGPPDEGGSFQLLSEQAVWAAEVSQELWQILPANTLDPNNYPIFNARGYSHKCACTISIMVVVGDDA